MEGPSGGPLPAESQTRVLDTCDTSVFKVLPLTFLKIMGDPRELWALQVIRVPSYHISGWKLSSWI